MVLAVTQRRAIPKRPIAVNPLGENTVESIESNMKPVVKETASIRRNSEEYRKKYSVLNTAGVGVIMTRTREPFRAIETLQDYAFAERRKFQVWTIAHGWEARTPEDGDAPPKYDAATVDPVAALRALLTNSNPDPFDAGFFVMMNPHKPIAQNIVMVQLLKEYAHSFSLTQKRLILITPPGTTLPLELEDDITILDYDSPSYSELGDSYRGIVNAISAPRRPVFAVADVNRLLSAGAGMTCQEFENAVSRAFIESKELLPNVSIDVVAQSIMSVKTEVVKRSEILEVMPSDSIENIGGLENLKIWISKRAKCFSPEARAFGVESPKGIALIGPPGTGKTASAKAIASVLGHVLVKLDVGSIFNSLVGESEKRIRGALKMVEAMAPCILFIDEIDKAFAGQAGGGGGGDSGVGSRVLGTILTWMQDTKAPVFMVVTANRTQNLPSEFLRKGRLDEVFSVTVPHPGERLAVLRIHLRKRGQNPDNITDLNLAVDASDGFVSAEIEGAVKDSIIEAFDRGIAVSGALIVEQLQNTQPLAISFKDDFDAMKKWAEQNARPASLQLGSIVETPRLRVRQTASAKAGRFEGLN